MIIDTHCHLNFHAFKDDGERIIEAMVAQDVRGIVVGSQRSTSERAIALAQKHPQVLYAAVALHPLQLFSRKVTEVEFPFTTRAEPFDFEVYKKLALHPVVVAIGECGLDYYQKPEEIDERHWKQKQREVFLEHLRLAEEVGKPAILHARSHPSNHADAHEDAFEIVQQSGYKKVVWHALATQPEMARTIIEAGYLVGFTGLITHKEFHEPLAQCVRLTPLEQMVIETDSPYMPLEGNRHERNTPLHVIDVAREIARIKNVSFEEIVAATTHNATSFFQLKSGPSKGEPVSFKNI